MALKDLVALIDHKLADVFHAVKYDPNKDRNRLLKVIANKRSVTTKNGVAEFHIVMNGHPLKIDGKSDVIYAPEERAGEVLGHLEEAVRAGEFDAQLEAMSGKAAGDVKPARAPRAKREGGGAGWSDERRAKFAATVAARKAAQGA